MQHRCLDPIVSQPAGTRVALGILVLVRTVLIVSMYTAAGLFIIQPTLGQPPSGSAELKFIERSRERGLVFTHRFFGTGQKYMPENMAPGVTLLDYDGDGRLDVYLVQGSPIEPDGSDSSETLAFNRLFRQQENGSFVDVSQRAGVADRGYGMGSSAGDYDGDGDLDLYVANYGANVLYRNLGDGSFEDVTAEAGVGDELWSVGTGFFDPDGDGDLDLFVVHYVDFAFDNHHWCGNAQQGIRAYCHPDVYNGVPDILYRNNGDGTFTDVSREAGLIASTNDKGLGVAFADFDDDGNQDVYVANDSTMNYLYLGDGTGRFEEGALFSGVGLNAAGAAEASMGVVIGDLDGDQRQEMLVTHLDQETNSLYRTSGAGLYDDVTEQSGLASPSLPWVSFGNVLLDHDNDGDLDLFVTNGHIIDNIELFDETRSHRQPSQFFDNDGQGRFTQLEDAFELPSLVGRGAAAGDLDNDGDLDIVVAQNGDSALLLENRLARGSQWVVVRPHGTRSGRQAFGTRIVLSAGKSSLLREVRSSSGYLSQGPAEAHFGLGANSSIDRLEICWPSGQKVRYGAVPTSKVFTLYEP